ncbi:SPOR domain-containing protein [Afifella pfennigii]|uniref:SPOR domain-containing protein n=1 Tax=Afifella pfennigii TaxID=209897 RepID=UPI000478C9D0|nr:SPOR domain-containing protein [Afifella pfennigii]
MADNRPKTPGGSWGRGNQPGEHEEDDPLVELARIVSEDGSYFGSHGRGDRPAAPERSEPELETFSSELEAELMREFEQTQGDAPAQPGSMPASPSAYRPIGESLPDWSAEQREAAAAEPAPEEPPAGAGPSPYDPHESDILAALAQELEQEGSYRPEPTAEERREAGHADWSGEEDFETLLESDLRREEDDWGGEAPAEVYEDEPPSEEYAPAGYDVAEDYDAPGRYESAGFSEPANPYLDEPETRDFQEPQTGALHGRDLRRSGGLELRLDHADALESRFGEPPRREGGADDLEELGSEFPFLNESEPLVTPADAEPDGPSELAGKARQGKTKRAGLMALAGVLGVVVIGGGVFAMLGGQEGDPDEVPVITADSEPVKVPVEDPEDGGSEEVGQAVFDRVAGRETTTEGQLVDRNEEPREIARIVLPNGQTGEAGQADEDGKIAARISDETQVPEIGPEVTPIGPKKVRTVIVRPDGTIVESPEPQTTASDEPTEIAGPAPAENPEPVRVQSVRVGEDAAATGSESPALGSPSGPLAGGQPQEPTARESEPVDFANLPAPRPAPPALQAPEPTATPTATMTAPEPQVAAVETQPVVTETPPAGWAVQVSSQRSEEQARASFTSLQQRFPTLLGDQQPYIQEADLGDKGVYYRVRVGPMADRNAAISLCEDLKSAGGSCFVTR